MRSLSPIILTLLAAFFGALSGCSEPENEYLDEFMQLPASYRHQPGAIIGQSLESKREDAAEYQATRARLVTKYAWAVPNQQAIETLKRHSPNGLVDFGAGSGYWAKLLSEAGVNVVAIDNWTDKKPDLWFPVTQGSHELLPETHHRTLLLCWPPHASEMARRAVQMWGGNTMAYVGEPGARGNADPSFFQELQQRWVLKETVEIPRWFNRTDQLFIYQRKYTHNYF